MAGLTNLSLAMLLLLVLSKTRLHIHGKSEVPCFFIFGDSMVDNGNNNHFRTKAKVNYRPYGIDFPDGSTGRFTNGKTVADVVGELLGFKNFLKSFAAAKGSQVLKGVNYASGYSGIRDETGQHMGHHFPLNAQLRNHQVIMSRILHMLGPNYSVEKHLNQCLYLSVIGNNDYINNYFLPNLYNTSRYYTPKQYAHALVQEYGRHLKTLHGFGARKVAVVGVAPIGCTPNATAYYGTNGSLCVEKMNHAANLFNKQLKLLLYQLNTKLTSAKFIYLDLYFWTYVGVSTSSGTGSIKGCCPVNDYGLCIPAKPPCRKRNPALFWDSFHPSEFLHLVTGAVSYSVLKKIL